LDPPKPRPLPPVTAPSGNVGYKLDAVGNRLQRISSLDGVSTSTDTFNENDWLNTDPADTYDDNGNTTTLGDVYDFENRLVGASRGGNDIFIQYDGDGNRVSKTVNGVKTWYLVDGLNHTGYAQVMEECIVTNSQVVVLVAYAYGLDLISQTFPPLSTLNPQPSTFYYGYDGHGSVRYLTDDQGGVTDTYDYDAFGVPVQVTGTTPNCYFYAGEQLDHDLGMYFLRARYLNQEKGRFWTMDTWEGDRQEPLSLHKYLYANADPVNGVDPSGNMTLADVGTAMKSSAALRYVTYFTVLPVLLHAGISAYNMYENSPLTPYQESRLKEAYKILRLAAPSSLAKYAKVALNARKRATTKEVEGPTLAYTRAYFNGYFFNTIHIHVRTFDCDPKLIAATLVHEAVHLKQFIKSESQAYQVESDYLHFLGIVGIASELNAKYSGESNHLYIHSSAIQFYRYKVKNPAIH
jgi:RHS repeat-associated protein